MTLFKKLAVLVILAAVPATVFAQGGRQSPDEFRRRSEERRVGKEC